MKRMLSFGVLALTLLLFITACGKSKKTAEIIIDTPGGIPYNWEYKIENTNIVKFSGSEEESNNDSNMMGSGTKTHYLFEGVKQGTTTITFSLKSFLSDEVAETKTYQVVVNKDLSVTITEKN